ncbi:MAG: cyclic nucleotide-binding domain-containing protein [Dongiaceae bacterium]
MRRQFRRGEILFRQGDPSDCVLRIDSGSVEVLREVGDVSIVLGSVLAGQFVGEMGVIERRPRNATARAATTVEAEQFSVPEFFERVSADPAMAAELMLRLSVRLREIEDKVADDLPRAIAAAETRDAPAADGPLRLQLAADTAALREQIGPHPVQVDQFPFIVGRRPRPGEKAPRRAPDLLLDDQNPFRLSRQHFVIDSAHGRLVVRDLDSALGTLVNDEPIGSHFRADVAELRPGPNRIVAGGFESDFAFTALVG